MLVLESSLRPFPMALERPERSKLTFSASPGHLAAFASKCLRNQSEAAVDPGVKGTYTCSFETVLAGMFCTTNSLGNGVYLSPCKIQRVWVRSPVSTSIQVKKATAQSQKKAFQRGCQLPAMLC